MLLHYFRRISSIPHTSGHEAELRNFIAALAAEKGLASRTDAAGNLLLVRPPSPGLAGAPSVILQAHLDMVPEKADGVEFDFLTQGIVPVEKEGFLTSSLPTTLGADNGIGVAAALTLLFDADFRCGELRGLFTVGEESGLDGASALAPGMLSGDVLLNLDSEEDGVFIVGCAGGMNTRVRVPVAWSKAAPGTAPSELDIRDLPGGHSGIDIGKNIPNAICEGLKKLSFPVSSLEGGGRGSAIPRSFSARCGGAGSQVWAKAFQERIVSTLLSVPNGALEFEHGQVSLSGNFGAISCREGGELELLFNQRGFDDGKRRELSARIASLFRPFGATVSTDSEYGAWKADFESPLSGFAASLYAETFGKHPRVEAIHAGLECGFFTSMRPELAMLSFGPEIRGAHSPGERLDLASLGRFEKFLRRLVAELGRRRKGDLV